MGCLFTSDPIELPRTAAHVACLRDPEPAAALPGTRPSLAINLWFQLQSVTLGHHKTTVSLLYLEKGQDEVIKALGSQCFIDGVNCPRQASYT